jgi:ribonuclease BN (tRNA processing enzyme)
MTASRSSRDLAEAAARQVVSLGYASEDVRHIVQTHLHVDHAACFRMRRDCVPCSTTTKMRSSYSVPMIQMN